MTPQLINLTQLRQRAEASTTSSVDRDPSIPYPVAQALLALIDTAEAARELLYDESMTIDGAKVNRLAETLTRFET